MTEATFDNGVVQLYQGDARRVLRELPAESVHCVVTSPPYLGLRDYGLEPLVWGGDEGHAHEWGAQVTDPVRPVNRRCSQCGRFGVTTRTEGFQVITNCEHCGLLTQAESDTRGVQAGSEKWMRGIEQDRGMQLEQVSQGTFCLCGAWRGSLGLEPTIDLYVQHIVEVFREVRRVLRKDGTLWLNMGDSYAGSGKGQMGDGQHSPEHGTKQGTSAGTLTGGLPTTYADLKPKDLCMMPARVALALQADGWWLRSDIVWSKPNPMPESVTDRPTRAHEYLFLLTKAERCYYDADAIREPMSDVTYKRLTQPSFHSQRGGAKDPGEGNRSERRALINQNEKLIRQEKWGSRYIGYEEWKETNAGRNKRSVWEIATEPMDVEQCERDGLIYDAGQYRKLPRLDAPYCDLKTREEGIHTYVICRGGAHWDWSSHFATFPQALVEPCVLAGTSERGVCPDCGAPWERVVERSPMEIDRSNNHPPELRTRTSGTMTKPATATTTGWRPTCDCGCEDTVPSVVLDPFAGSGTVAYVAQRLGRRSIGIDLSAEYLALAGKRMRGQTLPMGLSC